MEVALYLPVPLFGYLSDRLGPGPPSVLAGVLFGFGYVLAAFTYKAGQPPERGGEGWPVWVMVLAFVGIGMGTASMYLSAVSTCAKNFGRGKNRGFALAVPIAAYGLSGMWQCQVGSRLLYERLPDGSRGDVDVFLFFIFLSITLLAVGIVGGFLLRVIDEEDLIDEAVEELEQSGLLGDDQYYRSALARHYGTMEPQDLSDSQAEFLRSEAEVVMLRSLEDKEKKKWLLNEETKLFLSDRTMWWLAAGFFLVTGPGEAFINNMGTIIGTLYPPSTSVLKQTSPATHVSIVAITSTVARLITGSLTDMLAPTAVPNQHRRGPRSLRSSIVSLPPIESKPLTVSRLTFLMGFSFLLSVGQLILASGLIQKHGERFWIVSSFIGAGYGAVFSLVPIIISVVWGVENFGTNWGIVAMVPAFGAALWGMVYSGVYQYAAHGKSRCFGAACYAPTFWAMSISVWIACCLWIYAWRGPRGWIARGIAI